MTVAVVVDEDGKEILDERGEPKFVCAILQNAPPPHWVLSKSARASSSRGSESLRSGPQPSPTKAGMCVTIRLV